MKRTDGYVNRQAGPGTPGWPPPKTKQADKDAS